MFGRKARKIDELQAKLTGKDIDLRAALKARADAEARYSASEALVQQAKNTHNAQIDKLEALSAERDQLSARVEELESELEDATRERDRADGEQESAQAELDELRKEKPSAKLQDQSGRDIDVDLESR